MKAAPAQPPRLTYGVLLLSAIMLCGCEAWPYTTRRACSSPGFNALRSLALWRVLERPLPPCPT